ncbi:hypothetical protein SDC9_138359 [bioreactor metagenome]|uniref:Uncharacterized protein n=1 Tax=bioreactor metagenome TaxID=1076179 RepID=A0A645DRZ7_9ZZZZ
MLGDIGNGKIVGDESPGQAGKGNRDQQGEGAGRRPADRGPGLIAVMGANQGKGAQQERNQRRQDQGEMAKFRNHAQLLAGCGAVAAGCPCAAAFWTPRSCASLSALAASGGM